MYLVFITIVFKHDSFARDSTYHQTQVTFIKIYFFILLKNHMSLIPKGLAIFFMKTAQKKKPSLKES